MNVAKLERTLAAMYHQWGDSVNSIFDDFLPEEYQAGYERAKVDLTRSGVWQNVLGGPDTRRIQNALDSVYNNVALRTDKMSFDHIWQLRNFSAKVFREAAITGETRRQVSERLENEALQVPGFQFTDIAGRKWSHKSYFEMLARTELMNGARDSYEQQCAAEGYNIMLLSVSGHCCEACAKYEGQYFSIGPNKYGLPTKDDLEAAGVFHPNCTHSYSAVPDYIIEKEFGKQEKGSSPSGQSRPSSPSGHSEKSGSRGQSKAKEQPTTGNQPQQILEAMQNLNLETKSEYKSNYVKDPEGYLKEAAKEIQRRVAAESGNKVFPKNPKEMLKGNNKSRARVQARRAVPRSVMKEVSNAIKKLGKVAIKPFRHYSSRPGDSENIVVRQASFKNGKLDWTGVEVSEKRKKAVEDLQNLLDIMPKFKGTVYRGCNFPKEEDRDLYISTLMLEPEKLMGFISTTPDPVVARHYASAGKNKVVIIVPNSQNGVYFGPYSTHPEDEEALISYKFYLKGLKKYEENGIVYVLAEEVAR